MCYAHWYAVYSKSLSAQKYYFRHAFSGEGRQGTATELILKYQEKNFLTQVFGRKSRRSILVDTEGKRIIGFNGKWFEYSEESVIVLKRNFAKTDRTKYGETSTRYVPQWSIVHREGVSEVPIHNFTDHSGDLQYLLSHYSSGYVALAEELAEITGLSYIDATEYAEIIRTKDRTDIALQTILKNGRIPKFNGIAPPVIEREYRIKEIGSGFVITDKHSNFDYPAIGASIVLSFMLIFSFFSIYFIASFQDSFGQKLSSTALFALPILGIGYAWVLVLNRIVSKYRIEISFELISVEKRGTFRSLYYRRMEIMKLEHIVRFHIENIRGLELVSDKLRIPIYGMFNEKELDVLEDIIKQILVTV